MMQGGGEEEEGRNEHEPGDHDGQEHDEQPEEGRRKGGERRRQRQQQQQEEQVRAAVEAEAAEQRGVLPHHAAVDRATAFVARLHLLRGSYITAVLAVGAVLAMIVGWLCDWRAHARS